MVFGRLDATDVHEVHQLVLGQQVHAFPEAGRELGHIEPVGGYVMDQATWNTLSTVQKDKVRDLGGLSPQLVGLEGWRVEVVTNYGETRRFIVGRSAGWYPCHLEVFRRSSSGGVSAEKSYQSIKKLYQVR